jgi:hypothetical protein
VLERAACGAFTDLLQFERGLLEERLAFIARSSVDLPANFLY